MPVDPVTGERLPYPEDEKPQDNKQTFDETMATLDQMVPPGTEMEGIEEEEVVEAEAPGDEGPEGADLTPLMETLGATEERAQMLYDAAQQFGKTAGKTPQELADMIADDFDVLMQLEMIAARGEGGAMGGPAAEPAVAGPPMVEEQLAPEGI